MKLVAPTFVASLLFVFGCASSQAPTAESPATLSDEPAEIDQASADESTIQRVAAKSESNEAERADARATVQSSDGRNVGDYVTYSFSGSYRKSPLKLTQRVVAKTARDITIDYTFSDKKKTETLRVVTDLRAGHRGEVVEVSRVESDGTTAKVAASVFEAWSAQTVAITDENEALLDETTVAVNAGPITLSAIKATYRVRIGKSSATLETTTSAEFAWGDLGGSIVGADGTVFYRAEILDMGGANAARASLE